MQRSDPGAWRRYAGFELVPLRVVVRVGTARCSLGRLAALDRGEILVLDRPVGAPFDLLVAGTPLAQVEPVAAEGGVAVKLVQAADADDESDT